MVIFPLLLVPLMLTIVTNIQIASVRKAEDKVLRVGLVTNANGPALPMPSGTFRASGSSKECRRTACSP